MHFCAKNALCQHLPAAEGAFGKPFMVQIGPFWPLFAVLWLQKVPKTAAQTPQNQPKMRQNHPKMGFEGLLDSLKAISIPSRSTSKRIKNKNLDRFWVPQMPPKTPLRPNYPPRGPKCATSKQRSAIIQGVTSAKVAVLRLSRFRGGSLGPHPGFDSVDLSG